MRYSVRCLFGTQKRSSRRSLPGGTISGSKVSIRAISRRTGYAPSTVSNALNGKPGVGTEAAAKIVRTAEEMGYHRSCGIEGIHFLIGRNSGRMITASTPRTSPSSSPTTRTASAR